MLECPSLTRGVVSAWLLAGRGLAPRVCSTVTPDPPCGLLCPHPQHACTRGHTWPHGLGGTRRKGWQEAGCQWELRRGGPGGRSTWGGGVGRVQPPVEAICPWAWPAVPAEGAQVSPRPCLELQQGWVWPRGRCHPTTMSPASPTTSPGDTPCPSPGPSSTSEHPGPVHIRSPHGTPEVLLGGHGHS